MEFKSIDSCQSQIASDDDRQRRMNERISRLRQVSNESIQESQETLNYADSGMITEEDMMNHDPEMSGMTQYSSNGTISGANVPTGNNQTAYYQQMQNSYNYQSQNANVDYSMYNMYNQTQQSYQQPQQQPIYYQQPQQQQNQYPYGSYYSQASNTSNIINTGSNYYTNTNTNYYQQPQMRQYNTGGYVNNYNSYYNNPYGLDPRDFDSDEDMAKEYNRLEEERKRYCDGQVALAMYFRDFAEVAGATFEEDRDTYESKIRGSFGYKTIAQMKIEKDENNKKAMESRNSNSSYSVYNERGYREHKSKMEVGIIDKDGKYKVMSKPVDPETGYRTTIFTRKDDEVIEFNKQHFWDVYNKEATWYANFVYAINNRVKEFKSKFPDSLTWDQLVGPECKMADYYDEVVTKEDSAHFKVSLLRGRWSNGSTYNNNFYHSGMDNRICLDNMSNTFRLDYGLAKQIHAANLSKTPDEIELSNVLNNSLQRDYDQKRAIFVNKMISGNARTNMAAGATQREVISAPDINAMVNAEASAYLAQCEKDEEEKRKALLRDDNLDPTGGHIMSVTEIENPGFIPGTNFPIAKRTITTGVMSDDELDQYDQYLASKNNSGVVILDA